MIAACVFKDRGTKGRAFGAGLRAIRRQAAPMHETRLATIT